MNKPFKMSMAVLSALTILNCSSIVASNMNESDNEKVFSRIASFPVYLNTDINSQTVAEIVAATADGNVLVYTDSETENLGYVDIVDPSNPEPMGVTALGGEPTSVAVLDNYALVAVNTSPSFLSPSGKLVVVDISNKVIVNEIDLGGQPDSIAISPDQNYAAVVIENERDEDLKDGAPPQAPAGYLSIIDLLGEPADWDVRNVSLTGLSGMRYENDPEPEFVAINRNNIAVVTLQENNHIALVDVTNGTIVNHFSAGLVSLEKIDTSKDKIIALNGNLSDLPREPDGVSWVSDTQFATADEGDLDGGSRGFTLFDINGNILYTAGNHLEHTIVRHGHYPDKRSAKKGNEPENVAYGKYSGNDYLFVGSERASVILVYKLSKKAEPEFIQLLPAAVKPEGLLAIPGRELFVAAGEEDSRSDKIRSALTIYKLDDKADYPAIVSKNRKGKTPIPWGALSGLAVDLNDDETAYSIHDSFYNKSRIFKLDIDEHPAVIKKEIILSDMLGKLASIAPDMVNTDGSVNLDQEGIASSMNGGFWIASEGRGTVGDASRPFETYNLLLKVNRKGVIEQLVKLPETVNARQVRFGFEGVASVESEKGELLYVVIQREWSGDPKGMVRIGRYNTTNGEWRFYYYPLDKRESANGGWVGLSEITALGDDTFMVIERDNQAGPDAEIKRLYQFSVSGLTPVADTDQSITDFPVVRKTLVHDLIPDLNATGGLVLEKIEGLAVLSSGDIIVVNDNDGVDDSNGETQLIKVEKEYME